jgi:hypothetical protein
VYKTAASTSGTAHGAELLRMHHGVGEREAHLHVVASDDTLTALLANDEAMRQLRCVAAREADVAVDSFVAHEIVADAVGDLYIDGARRNPPYGTIREQLLHDVQQRAAQERKSRRRHLPIDKLPDDEIPRIGDDDATAPDRDSEVLRARLVDVRRHLDAADLAGHELLTLYELGILKRAAILAMGMTDGVYRGARRRVLAAIAASPRPVDRSQR